MFIAITFHYEQTDFTSFSMRMLPESVLEVQLLTNNSDSKGTRKMSKHLGV